jgi:hypothetical protein
MSKDMLGSVVRSAVGVPQRRLDLLAKLGSLLSEEKALGKDWHEHLKQVVEEGLSPKMSSLGSVEINYDQPIAEKFEKNPEVLSWHCAGSVSIQQLDLMFPDERTGVVVCHPSVLRFRRKMREEDVIAWCRNNTLRRATPKEGLDIALKCRAPILTKGAFEMAGQCGAYPQGRNDVSLHFFCSRAIPRCTVDQTWGHNLMEWPEWARFLVLEDK